MNSAGSVRQRTGICMYKRPLYEWVEAEKMSRTNSHHYYLTFLCLFLGVILALTSVEATPVTHSVSRKTNETPHRPLKINKNVLKMLSDHFQTFGRPR
ncbi:unnamed protein product [Hymenolepis diminuta]|uniref:Uncharacterized protein n=1 Tax=Hymenolepis diminuta TaxID=6216 RepID=A0A564Y7B1_HYMDI|nr:unnamed protein product [Hymenolepis diminuta]